MLILLFDASSSHHQHSHLELDREQGKEAGKQELLTLHDFSHSKEPSKMRRKMEEGEEMHKRGEDLVELMQQASERK